MFTHLASIAAGSRPARSVPACPASPAKNSRAA